MRDRRSNFATAPPRRGQPAGAVCPAILMYHAVTRSPRDPNRLCVSPHRLDAQMRHLERRGLRGVSMRELLQAEGTERARSLIGLTFDDGYENFLGDALPILERHGFTATVFVLGGMLGANNTWDDNPRMRLLDADGVREAAGRGMEIGVHGMSHVHLAGLPEARLEEEVFESRRGLEEVLDETVEGFCYPYGRLDAAAVRAVREAGYSYGCSCWTRVENTAYDLPRMPVWEMDRSLLLQAKLGSFPLYSRIASRLRTR